MKTIDKLSFVPLLALLLFAGSCEKDGGVFMRENDAIACDCTEQSISQNVLCDGEWVADCGDVGWIAITPERGSGNGKDYGFFTLNIQYNSGAERTATVHLVYDGAAYPITVTQGACEFAYGEPRVEGNLFRNIESTATLRLPYVCASGRESVEISCTITGAAADGLSVTKQVYTGFAKGSGELTIPVEGAATRAGAVAFELFADGVSVGSCRANVISDPDAVPEGLPVGWNFYALGMTGTAPRGSEWDYSWTTDAIHPATDTNPLDAHRLLPTAGNENAYLTASGVVSDNGNYTFNPGIQIKGLMENDYFLFVIPVRNIKAEHKLSVEASMGAAGSGPGYYALEYSADNKTWMLAEGSTLMEVFGTSAQVLRSQGEYQRGSENLRQVHRQGVSEIRLPADRYGDHLRRQPLPASAHLHGPSCQRLRKHEYDRLGMGRPERLRSRPGRRINNHRASPEGNPRPGRPQQKH